MKKSWQKSNEIPDKSEDLPNTQLAAHLKLVLNMPAELNIIPCSVDAMFGCCSYYNIGLSVSLVMVSVQKQGSK